MDGVSATHSLTADQPMDVNTIGANNLTLSTNSTSAVTVDGITQDVSIVTGNFNVNNNANVTGNLGVDGATTLGDGTDLTTVNGPLTQTGATNQVTLGGNVDADNGLDVAGANLTVNGVHLVSTQTTAPTAAVAGANVTSAVLSNATDIAGLINITTSGSPAAGAQATVTFDVPYGTAPIVGLTPASQLAAGVGASVTRTVNGFTITFLGLPAASQSYEFFYQVIETQ
jgi:hypothetical protein